MKRALLCLLLCSYACMEVQVDVNLFPQDPAHPDPPPAAPAVQTYFSGPEAHNSDWFTASTVYRIFRNRVENSSGSPAKLLEPALGELLRQEGFRTVTDSEKTADFVLWIHLERIEVVWFPPREFIQTPIPRKSGRMLLDFRISTLLLRGAALGDRERFRKLWERNPADPAAFLREHDLTDALLFEHRFTQQREGAALPGQEGVLMGILAHQELRSYILRVQKEIPWVQ